MYACRRSLEDVWNTRAIGCKASLVRATCCYARADHRPVSEIEVNVRLALPRIGAELTTPAAGHPPFRGPQNQPIADLRDASGSR
jgi:hypothetical protein